MEVQGLRVCHLTKYYPPFLGGIEKNVQITARGQAALGAEVRVIAVNHRNSHGDAGRRQPTIRSEEDDAGVHVLRFGRRVGVPGFDLCPGLTAQIRREIQEGTRILHLHTPNPTMMLAVARLGPRARLVITHHNDIVRQRVARTVLRPIEARVYRQAARVLATSPPYAAQSRVLRAVSDRVEPVPLGIDLAPLLNPSAEALEHAEEFRRRFGDAPLWLSVGRLIYYKGLHVALQALAQVPGRLLVVGVGGLEPALRAQAEALGVADRVIWWGPATDDRLVGAYLAATALWFPSVARTEGFGLVQVEAMAAGCPTLNTDLPGSGVSWVSPHEVTGLTVPVGDASALAASARRLLDEPDLRARLSAAGPDRARREFDQDVMVRRVLDAYSRALDSGPR